MKKSKRPIRLIRLPEVEQMIGRKRTFIYEQMNAGRFPQAVRHGKRCTLWVDYEVQDWAQAEAASRG